VVVDNSALARAIGSRIRAARRAAQLTQQELAGDRYTKAYISALELGQAKPSMAALDYLASRLGTTADRLLTDSTARWSRLDADLCLASGRYDEAVTAYLDLADRTTDPVIGASSCWARAVLCRL
jgi:transcriptional regulator with XRE-family HTH domain